MLGHEHEDTIQSIAMVADTYSLGGRWDEAETLRRQVMETRKKKLGADHPDTLGSMNNLAHTAKSFRHCHGADAGGICFESPAEEVSHSDDCEGIQALLQRCDRGPEHAGGYFEMPLSVAQGRSPSVSIVHLGA